MSLCQGSLVSSYYTFPTATRPSPPTSVALNTAKVPKDVLCVAIESQGETVKKRPLAGAAICACKLSQPQWHIIGKPEWTMECTTRSMNSYRCIQTGRDRIDKACVNSLCLHSSLCQVSDCKVARGTYPGKGNLHGIVAKHDHYSPCTRL